jgi:hypothetical protein
VDDQGRASDLAEPAGYVVTVHQAPERPGELAEVVRCPLGVLLSPLGVPAVPPAGAQDDGGDDFLHRARPLVQPHLVHLLISRAAGLQLGAGLAVDQDQAAHPPRCKQRGPQADEAALGHAAEYGLLDAEVVQQGEHVRGQVPVAERPGRRGAAVAARIPRDHPVPRRERGGLGVEHRGVHQVPVAQHDRRPVAARVGVADLDPVDRCCRHMADVTARERPPP